IVVVSGTVTCNGTGAGTATNPFVGSTQCTMRFPSSINVLNQTHYTVVPLDFNLNSVTHRLGDVGTLTWHSLCDGISPNNCDPSDTPSQARSSSVVTQLASTTSTQIHNAAHQVVTSVPAGSTVHDFVTVTGQPGHQPPTGTVTLNWFTNNGCSGA